MAIYDREQSSEPKRTTMLNCYDTWLCRVSVYLLAPNIDQAAFPDGMPYQEIARFNLCARRYSQNAYPYCKGCIKEVEEWTWSFVYANKYSNMNSYIIPFVKSRLLGNFADFHASIADLTPKEHKIISESAPISEDKPGSTPISEDIPF